MNSNYPPRLLLHLICVLMTMIDDRDGDDDDGINVHCSDSLGEF